ncbi:hypothetical protein BDF20DRAFT_841682 [Mycotypha africana]|uniref:uncharacterized protein n=1 Tax=Mycotypha africana TaxID=64632 RepID=UPI002300A55B|nr:uncharacterized protein BDF20DRAFT_841682 [Mycotypha africana]KAI8990929.1 hypothetical protein BDF20DRAFT_841682 [Mycotypha africana]
MSTLNERKHSTNSNITAKLQSFLWKDIQNYIKTNNIQALSTLYSRYPKDTTYVLLNCLATYCCYNNDESNNKEGREDHVVVDATIDPRLTNIFFGLEKLNALELAFLYNREQIACRLIDWTATPTTTMAITKPQQQKQLYHNNSCTDNICSNNNTFITPLCYRAITILKWKSVMLPSIATSPTISTDNLNIVTAHQQEPQKATVSMHTSIFMKKATEKVARLYYGKTSPNGSSGSDRSEMAVLQNDSGISPSPSPVSLTYSSSSSSSTSSLSSLTCDSRWTISPSPATRVLMSTKPCRIKDNNSNSNSNSNNNNNKNTSNEFFVNRNEATYQNCHLIENEDNETDHKALQPISGVLSNLPYQLLDNQHVVSAAATMARKTKKTVQFSLKVILLDACARGDLEELKYYTSSAKANELNTVRDLQKRSLLHIAIMHRHEHLIQFLIEKQRVDIRLVDADGWTCAHYAAALSLWKSLSLILSFPESYDVLKLNNAATTTIPSLPQQLLKIEECPQTMLGRRKCKTLIQNAFIKLQQQRQQAKPVDNHNFETPTTVIKLKHKN